MNKPIWFVMKSNIIITKTSHCLAAKGGATDWKFATSSGNDINSIGDAIREAGPKPD